MKINGKPIFHSFYGPAIEAPADITKTTDTMMKSIGGDEPDPGDLDPATTTNETQNANGDNIDNSGDISTNTDNILNTPDAPEPQEGNVDMPEGEGGDMGDMGNDSTDEGGDDMGGAEDMAPPEPPMTPEQIKSITKLRDSMNYLYDVIRSNLDLLGDYAPNTANPDAQEIYYNIINHLGECKEMLYKQLSAEITVDKYPDFLKKYIAIRHVYDICLNMLNIHFQVMDITSDKKDKSRPQ